MVYPGEIFEHLQSEFFAALEASRVDADRQAVHRLRTTARRMEALLHAAKDRQAGNAKLGRKVDQALKALKPVRTAAGPVRDVDVQRGLLEEIVVSAGARMTRAERIVLRYETRKLQAQLKRYRLNAVLGLIEAIQGFEKEKIESINHVQSLLFGMKWMRLLKDAEMLDRRSAKGLDVTDPESLHAYRKHAKFARYLAEMDGESARSAQFVRRVRKVLDAIGGWHDWMLLTQLAKETVGKSSTLAKVLKGESDNALRRAVRAVESLDRRL